MTAKQLFDKGIYYQGTSAINGLHIFTAIVVDCEIGENRREVYKCDGTRDEAIDCAIDYFKQWELA